jgi:O-antigen ligase
MANIVETNNNTYKWDRKISFYVIFYFIASSCNMAIKNILPIPESLWGILSMLWGLGILFFMFKSLKEVLRRNAQLFFNSYLIFGAIYIVSIVLTTVRGEPLQTLLRDSLFLNFAWWIPVGVFSCSVKDKSILKETMFRGSFIISAVLLVYFYLGRVTVSLEDANMYSMTFGFAFILPIILHVSRLFERFNIWLLFFVFIEVLTLLIFANRGVVLSLAFYTICKIVSFSKKGVASFFLVLLLAVGGVIIASGNFLSSLNNLLDANDMQSRTLSMLADDNLADDSGRSEIWAICFDMIMDKPILGWGLGGEYHHIARAMGAPGANASAFTPHNGIIQAFVNFGVIGGFIVLILFLRPLFGLKRIKDPYTKELILITGSAALIPCLISSDGLFYKPELAIYLYLFYQYGKNKITKRQQIYEKAY